MKRFWDTIIRPATELLRPESIVEIGSDEGGNTQNLLDLCERSGATLHVVDPVPKYEASEWRERYGEHFVFHEDLSLNALPRIDGFGLVLIDGDHNWYTVFNELRLIEARSEELSQPFPLVMLHDIGWPYGRRDLYYAPETIPPEHRRTYERKGIHPDSPGTLERGGLNPHLCNAVRENELRSGVLTAVEDFLEQTEQSFSLIKVPGLNGLGILIPSWLREQNEELIEFLESVEPPESIAQVIERVERDRLETQIGRQQYREAVPRLRARHKAEVEELKERLAAAERARSQRDREAENLQHHLERVKELLFARDQKIIALEGRLEERSQELERARQSLTDTEQHPASDVRVEQLSRDVERLTLWTEQLNRALAAILASRRWRLGYTLIRTLRRVLRRPPEPPVPVAVQRTRTEFGRWRKERELEEVKQREPAAQVPVAPPQSTGAPRPIVSGGSMRSFGSPEHVLKELRDPWPITVLVPVHNAREELERCLESLLRNTTAPAELLLVDDASTDPEIPTLLSRYERLENVRILRNEENLGFTRTVNRGLAESRGDVALLNSDVEVTPRWLENLTLAAYKNPKTATVTAISDNAGAFSVPEIGRKNDTPEGLSKDEAGRLVTQQSGQVYPQTPTANGFCMYIKRAALEDVGPLDAENFPRGYGEENDFCMRAWKRGWGHAVDDTTFIFHRRQASFGEAKKEMLKAGRAALDRLHPEYTQLARAFVASDDMKQVGEDVRAAFDGAESGALHPRPRVLFVHHQAKGGTTYTNEDLMGGISGRYEPYALISNVLQLKLYRYAPEGPVLVEQWNLRSKVEVTEFSRPDYREAVFDLLVRYRFELVHIRHLLGHTFDLPEVAVRLQVPVILSFHDFYFSCPTVHLIDDHGEHCGGICTPGYGQCTLPTPRLKQFPVLKHAWLGTWRQHVERMFDHVDAFVTTSETTKGIHTRSLPVLNSRPFRVIEHGRDLEQARCAAPPGEGPIRILLPGNVNHHKGAGFVRALKNLDVEDRLEFHFLGRVAAEWRDLGISHGPYEREEFNERVREIAPAFMGIFSIWPETYCHTMTEAWAAGVPVLASDIGTLRERVDKHGGGWLLDFHNPQGSYERILRISGDREEYERVLGRADLNGIRSVREMADDYEELYGEVLRERLRFTRPQEAARR